MFRENRSEEDLEDLDLELGFREPEPEPEEDPNEGRFDRLRLAGMGDAVKVA